MGEPILEFGCGMGRGRQEDSWWQNYRGIARGEVGVVADDEADFGRQSTSVVAPSQFAKSVGAWRRRTDWSEKLKVANESEIENENAPTGAIAVRVVTAARRVTLKGQAIHWRFAWPFQQSKARRVRQFQFQLQLQSQSQAPSHLPPSPMLPLLPLFRLRQCGGRPKHLRLNLSSSSSSGSSSCLSLSRRHPVSAAAAWACVPFRSWEFRCFVSKFVVRRSDGLNQSGTPEQRLGRLNGSRRGFGRFGRGLYYQQDKTVEPVASSQ